MANICDNLMAVTGPKEDLLRLQQLITEQMKTSSWIGDTFATAITRKDYFGYSDSGWYTNAPTMEKSQDGREYLQVYYESSWDWCYDAWDIFLNKAFPNCQQVHQSEEGGCNFYMNTDDSRTIFPSNFHVEVERYGDWNWGNFETVEQIVQFVNECYSMKFKTVRQIEAWGERLRKNDNGYACIDEFGSY